MRGAGATYGLGSVAFSISGGATSGEIAAIDFVADPFTSLSDSIGNNVDFTADSGTITVQGASPVPEPADAALLLATAVLIAAVLARKRRVT